MRVEYSIENVNCKQTDYKSAGGFPVEVLYCTFLVSHLNLLVRTIHFQLFNRWTLRGTPSQSTCNLLVCRLLWKGNFKTNHLSRLRFILEPWLKYIKMKKYQSHLYDYFRCIFPKGNTNTPKCMLASSSS